MNLPDIIGFRLEDATSILHRAGFELGKVDITNPPKEFGQEYRDGLRIVRIESIQGNIVNILVCKMRKLEVES